MMKRKRRYSRKMRGGAILSPSSYPNPLPPGGPYQVGSHTNGLGKGFYYSQNLKPDLPNPETTNKGVHLKTKQSGGGIYDLVSNLPGGSDIYGVVESGMVGLKNLGQDWVGGERYVSPNPNVQPALNQPPIKFGNTVDINKVAKNSQTKAATYKN